MSSAANLYQSVINDVITSVRESFLDESVDENVLLELKNLWVQVETYQDSQSTFVLEFLLYCLVVCRNWKLQKQQSLPMRRMPLHLIPRWLADRRALAREGGLPLPSSSLLFQIPIGEPSIQNGEMLTN